MNSLSYKSRSVVLIFEEQAFYTRLNSISPNKKTLLVTELEKNKAQHLFTDSNSKRSDEDINKSLIEQISYKRVNSHLGLETDFVFFDAQNQFDVNAFTAICGTLVGGGELVMLLDYRLKSAIEFGEFSSVDTGISKTLLRFLKFLSKQSNSVARTLDNDTIQYKLKNSSNLDIKNVRSEFNRSQKKLIESIKRCAIGHAKRPIVLSANRGRGKSATLGLATAELLYDTQTQIFITAPTKQQLSIFYHHLYLRLEELTQTDKAQELVEKRVTFLPPDEASSLPKISGLLIVEEAGAIPTQILSHFLENSNRMIFSTTVDGYEGNGQGFEIRFKALLKSSFPQFKSLTLIKPARWPEYDLLEEALNTAFLLDQSKAKENNRIEDHKQATKPKFHLISKAELNKNEALLKSVYQLLVNAHYQTRPSDLEKILSQESLHVFVAKVGEQVIAASLTCREGPLRQAEIKLIVEDNARLPGHLLPQSLVAHQGFTKAASLTFLRVMRIAVDSTHRRQRIASQLIAFIEDYAIKSNVDLIGTSFSLFSDVVSFWYANRFAAVRIGIRKDSSTGSHTGEFLKVVNNKNKTSTDIYNLTLDKFNQSFCYLASSSLKIVASDVLLNIGLMQPALKDRNLLAKAKDRQIRNEIEQYLSQRRSLEMVEWQLYIMTKSILFSIYEGKPEFAKDNRVLEDYKLIFAKIIQRKSWQEIVSQFKFIGIKQSREKTRLAFEALFENRTLAND